MDCHFRKVWRVGWLVVAGHPIDGLADRGLEPTELRHDVGAASLRANAWRGAGVCAFGARSQVPVMDLTCATPLIPWAARAGAGSPAPARAGRGPELLARHSRRVSGAVLANGIG